MTDLNPWLGLWMSGYMDVMVLVINNDWDIILIEHDLNPYVFVFQGLYIIYCKASL